MCKKWHPMRKLGINYPVETMYIGLKLHEAELDFTLMQYVIHIPISGMLVAFSSPRRIR